MNAHTPFDANQDWTNPYCQNRSNDPMVDALLGNAYHVVRTVYCNLGYIKHLYDFLSKYGVVICVQSEAELKTLTTEAKYARIYDKSPAGDLRVTDYLYVEDDRTGVLPDDTTATGSWVKVATPNSGVDSKDGGYIPWVYNSGSATGGETSIRIPDETAGAPFMIVNGDWQTEGYDFEYDPLIFEIKFTTPLEQGDFVVVMRTGVPATPDNPNVSDWVTINWLYNHGAAVGGEQVIDIPYTFQSVPAVYKNGLRFCKGLANNSYTIDSDNNRILLTEPLATNDRLVIQLGGEAKILETVDHTIQEVARSANVKDSEVILSTDTTQVLNGKRVIYDVVTQRIYGLPILPTNVYINSVSNGQLTYSPGNITITLLDSYQQQNTRELWRRSLAEAGLTLVDGSFEEGATANNKTDAVWYIAGGQCYTWDSTFPKSVPADSIPESSGGINVGAWVSVGDALLRQELSSSGGAGLVGDIPKPITWSGFAGGAKGDSESNTVAITAANNSGLSYFEPEGYWPNTIDSTFNPYPSYRNYSGGFKLKRGLPGAGAENPYPLIWAEKTSKMKRVEGGTKWFDVAMQGTITLEPEASAFGIGVSGYVRSSAGDVLTAGKSVDAIGVHGSGKAIGRNGRVWGGWFQAGNGDDGSGVRSSQLVGVEINLVNLLTSQPHPENLPTGEGPYRGLIITTADGGKACGIGIDVGDGSGLAAGASGWWMGMRLRRNGVLPSGDWKNNYLEDTQQLKIEGSISNTSRYGGIRLGGRQDGQGKNFTYGINLLDASIQDANAINLATDHRIYWGPVSGTVKWIGYEESTGAFNFRNMNISINSTKVLGPRVTGLSAMTGTADGTVKNTETITLQELARYVKKLADAAIAHGFVGPT